MFQTSFHVVTCNFQRGRCANVYEKNDFKRDLRRLRVLFEKTNEKNTRPSHGIKKRVRTDTTYAVNAQRIPGGAYCFRAPEF